MTTPYRSLSAAALTFAAAFSLSACGPSQEEKTNDLILSSIEPCQEEAWSTVAKAYPAYDFSPSDLSFDIALAEVEGTIDSDNAFTVEGEGNFSGPLAEQNASASFSCTVSYLEGSDNLAVGEVTSFRMGTTNFDPLTLIDEEIEKQEQEEKEAEEKARKERQEREREEREREREEREREAAERRKAAAERAAAEEANNQPAQDDAPAPQPTQQPAPDSAPAPAPGPPALENVTMGPYGGWMGCDQAQSMWPTSAGPCYQGPDGNYYFDGTRQAMQ